MKQDYNCPQVILTFFSIVKAIGYRKVLMRLVQNPLNNIKGIEQKCPMTGHSFLPNDTDFGHIEKA